jgi:hypothetical protein
VNNEPKATTPRGTLSVGRRVEHDSDPDADVVVFEPLEIPLGPLLLAITFAEEIERFAEKKWPAFIDPNDPDDPEYRPGPWIDLEEEPAWWIEATAVAAISHVGVIDEWPLAPGRAAKIFENALFGVWAEYAVDAYHNVNREDAAAVAHAIVASLDDRYGCTTATSSPPGYRPTRSRT